MRAHFGLMTDNPPNRELLRRYCYKFMQDRNARNMDIMKVVPIAVELYFVPTEADVVQRQIRASDVVSSAHERYDRDWVGRRSGNRIQRLLHL